MYISVYPSMCIVLLQLHVLEHVCVPLCLLLLPACLRHVHVLQSVAICPVGVQALTSPIKIGLYDLATAWTRALAIF